MTTGTPKWPLDDTLRRAEDADRLVDEHGAALGDRVEPDTGEKLKTGITELRGVSKGTPLTKQKAATASERDLARDAHDLIMIFRELVKLSPKANAKLRAAMGVGEGLNPGATRKVLDALAAVAENAVELRACGAGQDDIDEAAQLAADLSAADREQSTAMKGRASATDTHVALRLRVQELVESVAVAGQLAFRKNAAIRKRFEALRAGSGSSGGGTGGGGGTEDGGGGGDPVN